MLITFDDGYRDFRDAAWPILRANDFTAEVFVPTDLVGANADWDAGYGPPAPLLSWEDAAVLAEEGVVFGSHLARHLDGLTLTTAALDGGAGALARRAGGAAWPGREGLRRALRGAGRAVRPSGGTLRLPCRVLDPSRLRAARRPPPRAAAHRGARPMGPRRLCRRPGDRAMRDLAEEDAVAAIVPAYNAEATLDETLRSVRAQTHRALGDPRCGRRLQRRHGRDRPGARGGGPAGAPDPAGKAGAAAARNRGIEEARAALVAPVDADDLWAPTKIERQVAALRQGGPHVALVYTWSALIDRESRIVGFGGCATDEGDVLARMCRGNLVGNGSAALMRRDAVLEAGGSRPDAARSSGAGLRGPLALLQDCRAPPRSRRARLPHRLSARAARPCRVTWYK